MLREKLYKRVKSRLTPEIIDFFYSNGISKIIIAGGALLRHAKDLDFYPHPDQQISFRNMNFSMVKVLAQTTNSTTVQMGEDILQFCRYYKRSLRKLIQSFDFAHCQVGAIITFDKNKIAKIESYWTPEYMKAMGSQSTFYTGSDYPLSSLVRINRVVQKLQLSRGEQVGLTLTVLTDVINRGFDNYDDFKDQLDAVDLGLVPEELDHIDFPQLKSLFNLLNKGE